MGATTSKQNYTDVELNIKEFIQYDIDKPDSVLVKLDKSEDVYFVFKTQIVGIPNQALLFSLQNFKARAVMTKKTVNSKVYDNIVKLVIDINSLPTRQAIFANNMVVSMVGL